jgi:hypothetical protein
MSPLFHYRRILAVALLTFISGLNAASGQPGGGSVSNVDTVHCIANYLDEAKKIRLGQNGRLTAQRFETEDGSEWVYGSKNALEDVTDDVLRVRALKQNLAGDGVPGIRTATSVTGSVNRTGVLKIFGDVDFEHLLVSRVAAGRAQALSDPKSPELARVVNYFRDSVERVVHEHPDYRFVELKAGEYKDPESGEYKGIKWTLDDIRNGSKTVNDGGTLRTVTLQEAFATNARIKADWAVPSVLANATPGAYQEATMLYRLGVQVGENGVRLRPVPGGNKEALPFRHVSVALDPEEALMKIEASHGESGMPIEEIHHDMLQFTPDDLKSNLFKFTKRAYAFLKFWPDLEGFRYLTGSRATQKKLADEMAEILTDPSILHFAQMRAEAKEFQLLHEYKISIPHESDQNWLAQFPAGSSIDSVVKETEAGLQSRIESLFEQHPRVKAYVDYQISRIPYAQGPLSAENYGLHFDVDPLWKSGLSKRIDEWKQKYPDLEFVDPSKMQIEFSKLGRLTQASRSHIAEAAEGLEPFSAARGGIQLSSDHKGLELRYSIPVRMHSGLEKLNLNSINLGAKPDSTVGYSIIRIPLAVVKDYNDPAANDKLSHFLLNEYLKKLSKFPVTGASLGALTP